MREVAEVIGVRQSRASQIHSMVLLKLKASLGYTQRPHLPPEQAPVPATKTIKEVETVSNISDVSNPTNATEAAERPGPITQVAGASLLEASPV